MKTVITSTELAAIRTLVACDLESYGSVLEVSKPELYEALVSVRAKLALLAKPSETKVSI